MEIEIMDQLKKGTTTVGLICKDSVVLASEKRATMGSFIASKAARKIYQVDDRMGLTTAGIVGDAQTLVRLISVEARLYKTRRQEPMTVKAMTTLLSNVLNGQRMLSLLLPSLALVSLSYTTSLPRISAEPTSVHPPLFPLWSDPFGHPPGISSSLP